MSIYKKINGKDIKVADNGILDHSQLSGTKAYNCHPISAIRGLPEKLTFLKTKIDENSEAIQSNITAIRQNSEAIIQNSDAIRQNSEAINSAFNSINKEIRDRSDADIGIENKAGHISLQEGASGTLVFTDYNGHETSVQGGYLPDDVTIELQEFDIHYNEIELTAQTFIPDTYYTFASGEYTLAHEYDSNETYYEKEATEKLVGVGLKTNDGVLSGETISKDLRSIKAIINGKGGYLDSYDFQTATPTQEELVDYAILDIGKDKAYILLGTLTEEEFDSYTYIYTYDNEHDVYIRETTYHADTNYYTLNIWDKTRVINLFTNNAHPNQDTWCWDISSQTWSNLGNISIISVADDDYLGLVKSSNEDYEGSVDMDGNISINGLPELAQQVNTNENKLNNLVVDTYSSANDKSYSAEYANSHFAPLSFVSKLYFNKLTATSASLIDELPQGVSNYLTITSNNDTFNWNSPAFTITRTLRAVTTLNEETSFTVALNFESQQNCNLAFGAKIKVSQDGGSTWAYISSNQQFGETDYRANVLSSTRFIVYTDELNTNTTYDIGSLLQIEIFLKGADTTSITNYISCGYLVDGATTYSYVQFNFSSMNISSDQIEDGAVTYEKLSSSLQASVDQIQTNTNTINQINVYASEQQRGFTYLFKRDDVWYQWTQDPAQITYSEQNGVYTITTMSYTEQDGVYNIGDNQ